MIIETLTFLSQNKTIIIGATATIAELFVIIINLKRRIKKEQNLVKYMTAPYINLEQRTRISRTLSLRNLLWAANPINLFKPS